MHPACKPEQTYATGNALLWLMTLCILMAACDAGTTSEASRTSTEGEEMVALSVDFQDGFEDDTVILHLDGKEVFRKERVSTQRLLGLAGSFKTDVEIGPVSFEISVPTRGIAENISLEVSHDTYLGLSIMNGKIDYIVSDESFMYE